MGSEIGRSEFVVSRFGGELRLGVRGAYLAILGRIALFSCVKCVADRVIFVVVVCGGFCCHTCC